MEKIRSCARCKITETEAPIHEHHKNGNHFDDRPENKMDLCANCHMTLHWNRWKLSDIGLEDIEILNFRPYYKEKIPKKIEMVKEINELKINTEALLVGIEYYIRRTHLIREIEHKKNLEYYEAIMCGRFPYEVRDKFLKIDDKYNHYKFKEQQELNLIYINYFVSLVGEISERVSKLESSKAVNEKEII